ncbi:MAG: tRNA pseudouridine(38-40) synthase TruA [Bacteroidota bacterium]
MTPRRYMLELAYNGASFHGWQRQPVAPSVQQAIEEKISLLLRVPIQILGCGRTDTGVHASAYFAHFDTNIDLPADFLRRLNKLLPSSIIIRQLYVVSPDTHARFSAIERAYRYDISPHKDPFKPDTITVYPLLGQLNMDLVHATAALLLEYEAFLPFCKTHSDAKTMRCDLRRAQWVMHEHRWSFHISADRFLRGMVRLIVGACLRVGKGQIELGEVDAALREQRPMIGAWSAPPNGLFLSKVNYSDRSDWEILF